MNNKRKIKYKMKATLRSLVKRFSEKEIFRFAGSINAIQNINSAREKLIKISALITPVRNKNTKTVVANTEDTIRILRGSNHVCVIFFAT
jgi:hypothetical protein